MSYKINQISSKLKLRYSEILYILKKKFFKKRDSMLHWGHEKMTVMFIPHNEKKIFNFQISKFTFLFFLVMFGVIIATSAFAVRKNQAVRQEEEEFLLKYKTKQAQIIQIQRLSLSIIDIFNDIKPKIEELYTLTAGTKEVDSIWNSVDLPDQSKNTASADPAAMKQIPEEIYELQQLQSEMLAASNTIRTIKNFVNIRNKVVSETPSTIPVNGHITSLFGWRRSPFGFGKDFHTGIDIAAPEGTPIRATAPGIVEMAGWGGGYGNMVRIKHKYGYETIYAHCVRLNASQGAEIQKGQVVGYVGATGSSTGNHCHYEIRLGNVPIDPSPYMREL